MQLEYFSEVSPKSKRRGCNFNENSLWSDGSEFILLGYRTYYTENGIFYFLRKGTQAWDIFVPVFGINQTFTHAMPALWAPMNFILQMS